MSRASRLRLSPPSGGEGPQAHLAGRADESRDRARQGGGRRHLHRQRRLRHRRWSASDTIIEHGRHLLRGGATSASANAGSRSPCRRGSGLLRSGYQHPVASPPNMSNVARELLCNARAWTCEHRQASRARSSSRPLLGLSDAIVDIVETGTTLRENGLEVAEDILRRQRRG